jgi:hypothetical protein
MGMATKDLMFMAQIQRKFAPDTRKDFGKVEPADWMSVPGKSSRGASSRHRRVEGSMTENLIVAADVRRLTSNSK